MSGYVGVHDEENGRRVVLGAQAQKVWKKNPVLVASAGVLVVFLFVAFGVRSDVKAQITALTGESESEDRLIPFLPELTKAAELASFDKLFSIDMEKVKDVKQAPYKVVRDVCRSANFQVAEPGMDRLMYEISIGNSGSTWQLIMISNIVRQAGYRFPMYHIDRETTEAWPGVENLDLKDKKEFGMGETFGRLFKIQHEVPELKKDTSLIFNAWKLLPAKEEDVNNFAKGACPCCFVVKDLLGNKDAEIAMIYMHAFAMGIDLTPKELYQVRLKLAQWIKGHYCYPGSVHSSACVALEEFPELKSSGLPFNDYGDLEDEE
mmetsp:Transcript_11777/g.35917  ORF Transcript_11777/g.35917 Transcript_11777/m.35917 type:complete len:320 (+) Transcript_11777:302-1261(+)|eukprot:CAMPEP_0198732110 /NCGR_PEP_ID=MMETSP1475-20131203/33867_1 /TAXON_ID= ORGANISM="Unidentified sp., Strain CCMP1999" /NCGR_SAMPLE_ID=MMETSP1475 /ASSEMBLY_ACC=CAM_ASM_001111 /LENGTH=319 /DNA_ID=CAMNT_0044495155 /DNA_START=166 /DNA_END=1125 /DNA_ORIENTATION=-